MWRRIGLGLLLGIGLAGAAAAQGTDRFDGQYVGELTLDGVVSGDCTQPPVAAVYPLTISGGEVRFGYLPRFDTTLVGRVDAKGKLTATARVPSGVIRMAGQIDRTQVTARITSPSCRYTYQGKE